MLVRGWTIDNSVYCFSLEFNTFLLMFGLLSCGLGELETGLHLLLKHFHIIWKCAKNVKNTINAIPQGTTDGWVIYRNVTHLSTCQVLGVHFPQTEGPTRLEWGVLSYERQLLPVSFEETGVTNITRSSKLNWSNHNNTVPSLASLLQTAQHSPRIGDFISFYWAISCKRTDTSYVYLPHTTTNRTKKYVPKESTRSFNMNGYNLKVSRQHRSIRSKGLFVESSS